MPATPSLRQPMAALLAAAIATVALLAATAWLFDRSDPPRWLSATPRAAQRVAPCDPQPRRAERDRCARHLVQAPVKDRRRDERLAQR